MGFLSHRRANVAVRPEAKWDYIVSFDQLQTVCQTLTLTTSN